MRNRGTEVRVVFRPILGVRADRLDLGNDEIAARLDTPRQVVSKWRKRFYDARLAGLTDLPRGGRPPSFSP